MNDELTGEILMEYTLVGGVFTIKAVNTWGLGLISTNREGTKRYFHFDGLGSTRALTDSSENVTDTYEYNAFGVLEASSGSSVNPYRYVGQYGYYDDGAMGSASKLVFVGPAFTSSTFGTDWSLGLSRDLGEHPCDERTRDYCREARRYGHGSRALNCFCNVSRIICEYVRRGLPGAAFLDCMNRCIWKEYKRKESSQWKAAVRACRQLGMSHDACCLHMVVAEQEAFTRCFALCRTLPGAGEPPEWWWYCAEDNALWSTSPLFALTALPFPFADCQLVRQRAADRLCCHGVWGVRALG